MKVLASPLKWLSLGINTKKDPKQKRPDVFDAAIQPHTKQQPNSNLIGPITLQNFLNHHRIPFVQGSETTDHDNYMIFIYLRSDKRIIVTTPSLNAAMLWIIDNWNQIDCLKTGNAIYYKHPIQGHLMPSPPQSSTVTHLNTPGLLALSQGEITKL